MRFLQRTVKRTTLALPSQHDDSVVRSVQRCAKQQMIRKYSEETKQQTKHSVAPTDP